jgi:hypothetical protein
MLANVQEDSDSEEWEPLEEAAPSASDGAHASHISAVPYSWER